VAVRQALPRSLAFFGERYPRTRARALSENVARFPRELLIK